MTLPQLRELFGKTLEMNAGDRARVLEGLAPEARAELTALLRAHDEAASFLEHSAAALLSPGDHVGNYRIVAEIGHGGMGVVYRAVRDDGEFTRQVAIKVVGGRVFAPEAERRFIAERNFLASLDHPNIVRMIDGGVCNRQRYLVMEYVDGEPVTAYCQSRNLCRSDRLRILRTLCEAVHYAHQRLILHRDLKPENIVITAEGQLKILDFGIATMLAEGEEDSALTPLTPSCASPEQLRGERLTVASDVCALGLLGRQILTGLKLAPDVEAILAKATASDPTARYGTALELSADIQRYLERRPVAAHPASFLYPLRCLVSRNKTLTALTAALVVAVVAGYAATSWQARLAERRFESARRLIHTVIHEVQPQLEAVDGTVAVRKILIEKTLVYLEALWADSAGNVPITRELVDSYVTLAMLAGDAGSANLGDTVLAKDILGKAERLAKTLETRNPDQASLRSLVDFYRAAARNRSFYGTPEGAREYARKSVAAAERTAEPALQANALATLADVTADYRSQIALYGRALEFYKKVLAAGRSANNLRSTALMYKDLASAWIELEDYPRSVEHAKMAYRLDSERLKLDPASPECRMAVAFDLGELGWAEFQMHDYAEAAKYMHENVELRESVAAANRDDRRAADRLAYALRDLAGVELAMGDRAAARRDLERTVRIYDGLAARGPLVAQSADRYAQARRTLASLR